MAFRRSALETKHKNDEIRRLWQEIAVIGDRRKSRVVVSTRVIGGATVTVTESDPEIYEEGHVEGQIIFKATEGAPLGPGFNSSPFPLYHKWGGFLLHTFPWHDENANPPVQGQDTRVVDWWVDRGSGRPTDPDPQTISLSLRKAGRRNWVQPTPSNPALSQTESLMYSLQVSGWFGLEPTWVCSQLHTIPGAGFRGPMMGIGVSRDHKTSFGDFSDVTLWMTREKPWPTSQIPNPPNDVIPHSDLYIVINYVQDIILPDSDPLPSPRQGGRPKAAARSSGGGASPSTPNDPIGPGIGDIPEQHPGIPGTVSNAYG